MPATLQLTRPSRLTDLVWPYEILLDGSSAGEIKSGQTIQIPVTAAQHTLQVRSLHIINRLLRFSSPVVTFDVGDGATVSYSCRPSPFAKAIGRWATCLTGDRTRWITLER